MLQSSECSASNVRRYFGSSLHVLEDIITGAVRALPSPHRAGYTQISWKVCSRGMQWLCTKQEHQSIFPMEKRILLRTPR